MAENAIFFFSGTGNSYDIALKMAEKMKETDIINIASIKEMPSLDKYKRIGLIFPVYGFTMPNIVSRFISQLSSNISSYFFSIVTLGGIGFGAEYRTYEAFKKVGLELNYSACIYMPENYIIFSIVPGDSLIKKHLKNSIKRVEDISNDVLNYKKNKPRKTLMYYLVKNVSLKESQKWPLMAKHFTVNKDCNKCKICIKTCPVNNIHFVENNITFGEKCECCLVCMHLCPKEAINYGEKTIGKKRYINPNIKIEDLKNY